MIYQLTNEYLFLLVPHMYVYKHQPGVQCELGPEANIGKVSSVASRMWKSLLQDRRMVNTNYTHQRELGKVKSYG